MKYTKIDDVVRHRLDPDQLGGLMDVLVVMLAARGGVVSVSSGVGEDAMETALPPLAVDVVVDALSLLVSRERAALAVLDDEAMASVSDLGRILQRRHEVLLRELGRLGVEPAPHAEDWGPGTFRIRDVIDACRRNTEADGRLMAWRNRWDESAEGES